jgi:hypothetical protein
MSMAEDGEVHQYPSVPKYSTTRSLDTIVDMGVLVDHSERRSS